ncbi:hypothetical protein J1N35_045212 [Gossypium stocksii]|uniref:Uncharacterized protein n=1 Tax=Gossypium stocksii TaxID=47602 RepID=A0A9D3ZH65_9ROSI|nr:hypothetical protein J1N35_045212 [Gossypium stocksii]
MSVSDFNKVMGFVDSDDVQINPYHTLLDIPSDFDTDATYSTLTLSIHRSYNFKTSKTLPVHKTTLTKIRTDTNSVDVVTGCSVCPIEKLNEYCMDYMSLLADTTTAYYFVLPGTRTVRSDRVFRRQHNPAAKEQDE